MSFDQADRNPFRGILPLAGCFDFLEAILVATGAMHLSALRAGGGQLGGQEFLDALAAKDRAIRLLRAAIQDVSTTTRQTILAATVFLINLDLIDSGQGAWQAHMKAAGTLIPELLTPDFTAKDPSMAACIDAIAADCLTYHVLAAAITGVSLPSSWAATVHTSSGCGLSNFLPVLQRTEAYAYHCCPPEILDIIFSASTLSNTGAPPNRIELALALIQRAQSFDVVGWVRSIHGLSRHDNLSVRINVALAHRAAACLYIVLVAPQVAELYWSPSLTVEALVCNVQSHLSEVPLVHPCLKGTIWPTFLAGTQADDPAQREWFASRMRAMVSHNPWICPWGYIRTAALVMQQLWQTRDRVLGEGVKPSCLSELRRMCNKYLIV